jgi:threonine aldolase
MEARFREHFGAAARAYCVFGGTGANVLGLQSLARPHESVMCAEGAHIDVDECGAPEHYTGCKLVAIETSDGKLTPDLVARHIHGVGDQHHVQPRVVSITQSTEVGTVYEPREIRALADFAHSKSMFLHMDGARLANAAAALDVPFAAITTDAGVDVLSFGGTKNGLMGAEAVVFLNPNLGGEFRFLRKQGMQLPSKMRFVAAQLARVLEGELWKANASHANAMARRLGEQASSVRGVELAFPVRANGVFAILPREWIAPLQERSFFYVWDEERPIVRWMCSFDTMPEDVDAFVRALKSMAQK